MSSLSMQKQILGLIGWLMLSFAVSAVGAVASIQAKSFYSQLVQPNWAPPPEVFGPVWTVLYVLMAIAAWLIWRSGGFRPNRHALTLIYVAACLQRTLELAFLCLATRCFCPYRRLSTVDPYRAHPNRFLARTPACWSTAHPISAMG